MTSNYDIADLIDGAPAARVTLTHAVVTAQGASLVAGFFGKRLLLDVPMGEGTALVWTEDA
jgi:hypothetical protein